MSIEAIFSQISQHLQTAYRKAVDADNTLDELKRQGKGKFNAIFSDDQGFSTKADRFKPYINELAQELEALQTGSVSPDKLTAMVAKIAVLLDTLDKFKASLK